MRITETIKIIKKIVADPNKIDDQDPLMVATIYSEQCQVVNERLKKCVALIKNNMIPQALEEAEYDPHLIDLCHDMNGVAINTWKKLCREKGWTIPEDLNIDAFNEIMRIFSMESNIEPLLKQLRRANNQGHISQCVAILRQLVKKDPTNPQWRSDLVEFETAYLEKIKKDIEEFMQEKNINGVARLVVEIKEKWSIPTDSVPVKELENFIEEQYMANIRLEEKEIVGNISISFQSANVESLGDAIAAYSNLQKNRYFKPDPSLQVIYENALHWYQQQLKAIEVQKSYEKKLGEINNRIERSNYNGIRSLWDEIKLYRLPIPEDLEPDVQNLIEQEDRAKKRHQIKKQMGYVLILIFAMICVSVAATWNYYRQIRNRLTSELDSAVVAENLEESKRVTDDMARRQIAFINIALFSQSELQKHNGKVEGLKSLLEQKRASFDLLITELEKLKSEGFPENTEEIERKMVQIQDTANAITPVNIARLKVLQSAWESRKAAIRAMEERELTAMFEKIDEQFKSLLPAANSEDLYFNENSLEKIGNLIAQGEQLTSVSDTMKNRLNSLKKQLASTEETELTRRSQLQLIRNAKGLNEYIRELKTFTTLFPNDPVTEKIGATIKMEQIYNYLLDTPKTGGLDINLADSNLDSDSNSDKKQEKESNFSSSPQNPFWSATLEKLKALNNNIMIHKSEVQEELKKMERTARFVDLWECTVNRPNFEPEKWYFNGKPSEEFVKGIKSYSGVVYVLSPDDLQPEFKANSAITIHVQDLKKMSHCDVIQQMLNNIYYNIGMETIFEEIKNIYRQPFSPILKLHLISFLTDQMFTLVGRENASSLISMDKDLKRFSKRALDEQVHWLCTANGKYSLVSRQSEAILRHYLEKPEKIDEQIAKLKIEKIVMKRTPIWVGFADFKDPEKLHFNSNSTPDEVWVIRDNNTIKPLIFVTEEQQMDNRVKYLDHQRYIPGEALFAPYDNTTTNEVMKSILSDISSNRAANNKINNVLNNIDLPPVWPVNIR